MYGSIVHKPNSKPENEDVKMCQYSDFSAFGLKQQIVEGLKLSGYERPSPVQLEAIPHGRVGCDLIVQDKSGTGKTVVFAVIALEVLSNIPNLQVLILAPTTEVAFQISSSIKSIGRAIPNLSCELFIGGTYVFEDKKKLQNCQIAVGTLGRIKHLIKVKAMIMDSVKLFVLDEADKLMEDDFFENTNWIYNHLPNPKQVLAVSSTYPDHLKKLLKEYMTSPLELRINENELIPKGIMQFCITDNHLMHSMLHRKRKVVWELINKVSFSQCLIFCNCVRRVESLFDWLNDRGYSAGKISRSDTQEERLNTIEKLKLLECRVVVTSDLTARGIDAENVDLVINMDFPSDMQTYVHRTGRAGRYGRRGVTITIVSGACEEQNLKEFEDMGNFKVYPLPEPLPKNLLLWTLEMVTLPKAKNCTPLLNELKSESFAENSENQKNGNDDKSITPSHHESSEEAANASSLITQSKECNRDMSMVADNLEPSCNEIGIVEVQNLVLCHNEPSVAKPESSNMELFCKHKAEMHYKRKRSINNLFNSTFNSRSSTGNFKKQPSRFAEQSSKVKFAKKKPVVQRRGKGVKLSDRTARIKAKSNKSSYISGGKKHSIIHDHRNSCRRGQRHCVSSAPTGCEHSHYFNCFCPRICCGQSFRCSSVCGMCSSGSKSYFCHCEKCLGTYHSATDLNMSCSSPLCYGCGHHNLGLILHQQFMNLISS